MSPLAATCHPAENGDVFGFAGLAGVQVGVKRSGVGAAALACIDPRIVVWQWPPRIMPKDASALK